MTENISKLPAGFSLPFLDGKQFTPDWLKNRAVTLLVFYKRDCNTCTFLIPFLDGFYLRGAAKTNSILLISQDTPSETSEFVDALGIQIPVAVDRPGYVLSDKMGFKAVPALFLVDSAGEVILNSEGFLRDEVISIVRTLQQKNGLTPPKLFANLSEIPVLKPG